MRFYGNEEGFTLVELSIVLIIIGLIMAAVAKGTYLMKSAAAKKVAAKAVELTSQCWMEYEKGNTNYNNATTVEWLGKSCRIRVRFRRGGCNATIVRCTDDEVKEIAEKIISNWQ